METNTGPNKEHNGDVVQTLQGRTSPGSTNAPTIPGQEGNGIANLAPGNDVTFVGGPTQNVMAPNIAGGHGQQQQLLNANLLLSTPTAAAAATTNVVRQQQTPVQVTHGAHPLLNAAAWPLHATLGPESFLGASNLALQLMANSQLQMAAAAAQTHAGAANLASAVTSHQVPQTSTGAVGSEGQQNGGIVANKIGLQPLPPGFSSNCLPNARRDATTASSNASQYQPITKVLALDRDTIELSQYQCLVRKQIELFEQPPHKRQSQEGETTQGRNRPVVPGQVGIRCRHCAGGVAYDNSSRPRGAVLFPSTKLGLYQAAQNMANTHLIKLCKHIPEDTRKALVRVRSRQDGKKTCKSAYGGGRQYWANSLAALKVVETSDKRLRFSDSNLRQSSTTNSLSATLRI